MDDDEKIREMIKNENDLINSRIGWMNTLHGLLFAALGLAVKSASHESLIPILAIVGMVVSLLTLWGAIKALKARNSLLNWWENNRNDYKGPEVIGQPPSKNWWWITPWTLLPIVFVVAWCFVYRTIPC